MFARYIEAVKSWLDDARRNGPQAFDWASLIGALLPVILSLFSDKCQPQTVQAVRDGRVGPLERLLLARVIRRVRPSLRVVEACTLADIMADEAEIQQATPMANPSGQTWITCVAAEVTADIAE